jgi:proteasome component ECM29
MMGGKVALLSPFHAFPQAIESGQWAVKAQAARAMGTVATKLGGTIAPATQKRLADLLLAALAGRTWAGKECVLRSVFF